MANHGVALLAIALAMWMPVAARAQGDDPQIEKGRAVVAQVCTTCHTTLGRMLQVHKQTRAGHARRDRRGDGVSRGDGRSGSAVGSEPGAGQQDAVASAFRRTN